jgi:quinol monooxygenase YgiN
MVYVIASIRVKTGRMNDFLEAFKSNALNVKKERGCIQYLPATDLDAPFLPHSMDKDVVTIIEAWEDLDALRDHLSTPGMLAYREKTKDLVEDRSAKVLREV